MFYFLLNVLFVGLFTTFSAKADPPATKLENQFVQYLAECWQEFSLTADDLEKLRDLKILDSETLKCYFACAYKKAEMMNDKGEFWAEGVKKTTIEQYGNGEDIIKNVNSFIDICKKVNDVAVTDGEKGCERAALMFQCSNDHAAEFGF